MPKKRKKKSKRNVKDERNSILIEIDFIQDDISTTIYGSQSQCAAFVVVLTRNENVPPMMVTDETEKYMESVHVIEAF